MVTNVLTAAELQVLVHEQTAKADKATADFEGLRAFVAEANLLSDNLAFGQLQQQDFFTKLRIFLYPDTKPKPEPEAVSIPQETPKVEAEIVPAEVQ